MQFQPFCITGEDCPILGTQIRLIEIEMDVFYRLLKLLLQVGGKRRCDNQPCITDGACVVLTICWSGIGRRGRNRLSLAHADKAQQ